MAILPQLPSADIIKGFRGVLDFYLWKGIPVCRKWPRPSNLVPTPKQKACRENFRAIECWLKSHHASQRARWRAWQPPNSQTWVDYVHRILIPVAAAGQLVTLPPWTSERYVVTLPLTQGILDLEWSPDSWLDACQLDAVVSESLPDNRLWPWQVVRTKRECGGYLMKIWGAKLPPVHRLAPAAFDPVNGRMFFIVPEKWRSINYALIPHGASTEESFLQACSFLSSSV